MRATESRPATMKKEYIETDEQGLGLAGHPPWELQPGDSSRSHAAFRIYANLPPSQRSLAKAAEIVGKSHQQLLVWSATHDWVLRAKLWDHEQQRVSDAARLEAIRSTSQKAVEVGMLMLDAVEKQIPEAAKVLDRSPHALAQWVEVGAKLIRDGLATGEPVTVPGGPKAPVQNEIRDLLDHLTPGQVLQAREVALMLTEAKSRIANGLPPIDTAAQPRDRGTEVVPQAERDGVAA